MDFQAIFALTNKSKYNNFIGKTFLNKMSVNLIPDSDKAEIVENPGVELFFSTGHNGRGNTISITETGNGTIDLELFDGDVTEFQGIAEAELIEKLIALC